MSTGRKPTLIIGIFAIAAVGLIALTFAATSSSNVAVNVSGSASVATRSDTTAFGNDFILFNQGGGQDVDVPEWPIRNTDFDSRFSEYDETPSAQLPTDPFLGPVINNGVKGDLGGVNPRPKGRTGAFRVRCKISHFAYDDPIVLPGQPGASHLHAFFGNTRANGTSTDDSILNTGNSTCDGFHQNRSAYWVPTLHDTNGDVIIPRSEGLFVYYKTFVDNDPGVPANKDLEEFPKGFKIVSGNVSAALDQGNYDIDWWCGAVRNNTQTGIHRQQLHSCPKGGQMWMRIQFPYCWNGQNTYDTNNPHLVQPLDHYFSGKCPATHPQSIPSITYQLGYDTSAGVGDTSQWFLSSDVRMNGPDAANGSTVHGDWYGGWNVDMNTRFLNTCLRVNFECSVGVVGNNTTLLWPAWKYTIPAATGAKVPRETIRNGLCPGDTDSVARDVAMCMSVMQTSPQALNLMQESLARPIEAFDAGDTVDTEEPVLNIQADSLLSL